MPRARIGLGRLAGVGGICVTLFVVAAGASAPLGAAAVTVVGLFIGVGFAFGLYDRHVQGRVPRPGSAPPIPVGSIYSHVVRLVLGGYLREPAQVAAARARGAWPGQGIGSRFAGRARGLPWEIR